MRRNNGKEFPLSGHEGRWPLLICLLGDFRLLKLGRPVLIRPGGKTQRLLQVLALRREHSISREALLDRLWPDNSAALAGQSLNSIVYSLHKSLGGCIRGAAPIVHESESYRLNTEAGIGVDVACFDTAAETGDREARAGDEEGAVVLFLHAIRWYKGDLGGDNDVQLAVERERLRARYLNLLSRLADYYYARGDDMACLSHASLLISQDPCREDAHRLVMRCHLRQGARAQAIRQYRLCEHILRSEFDVAPEPATRTLFEQIRLDPGSI